MSRNLISFSIVGVVFALVLALGAPAIATTLPSRDYDYNGFGPNFTGRDFGAFHMYDVNRFGDDRAYTSTYNGADRDAEQFNWIPETYGLMGNYGYFNNSGGGG